MGRMARYRKGVPAFSLALSAAVVMLLSCNPNSLLNDLQERLQQTVATPTFTPTADASGQYVSTVDFTVGLSCSLAGASIYYTTDGSTPTTSSTLYSAPILVASDRTVKTIKAIAAATGMKTSGVGSATYKINYIQVSTPSIFPGSGVYTTDQSVTINDTTGGAVIHYTTDGSTPSASSPVFQSSFPVLVNGKGSWKTIKACAVKSGMSDSSVASATVLVKNDPGMLDTSLGTANNYVSSIVIQSDGKLIFSGLLYGYTDGTGTHLGNGVVRVNADGSYDTSFDSSSNWPDKMPWFDSSAVQDDGKILVGCRTGSPALARLNANGSPDVSFNSGGTGPGNNVETIALQPADGKILLGGIFTGYNDGTDHTVGHLARLNADGSLDTSFNSGGTGANSTVNSIQVLGNGQNLIGGAFSSYNDGTDHTVGWLARLNADGSLDTTFNSGGTGANATVYVIALQPSDSKILLGGWFTTYNGTSCSGRIARLNANGSLDTSFNSGHTGANNVVYTIAVQPTDGKIVIGGAFTGYSDGTDHPVGQAARLNASGSFDATFSPGSGFNYPGQATSVWSSAVQSDGRILLGGFFDQYNDGTTHSAGFVARIWK